LSKKISAGSACRAGSLELSPVLAAMGVPERVGMGAFRFSLGRTTTETEIDVVIDQLARSGEFAHRPAVHNH
jgi:cysteine desulfurase